MSDDVKTAVNGDTMTVLVARPSPADVDKIAAELTRLGIRHEFHRDDKTGHAFQNVANAEGYRPAAAEDAWQKTLRFLAGELAA